MSVSFGTNLATMARQRATDIHNDWGVGYQTSKCGGTGLLLFLAIDDHQIYLSRGKALSTILSSDRLTYVVGKMKPHLRDGQYEQGLTVGVQLLTAYISGDRPGFDETLEAVTTLLGILAVFSACIGCMACIDCCHRRRDTRLKQELRQDLARLDRDRQLALQGKYQSTSCPICLEDFRTASSNTKHGGGGGDATSDETNNGERKPLLWHHHHHEEPLKFLNCGHVFHQSCWDDFSNHPITGGQLTDDDDSGLKCPICRQPVEPSTATRSTQQMGQLINDAAYQPERRFRLERLQEIYPTFIGTQYVDQWYDPEYRGSLLEDYNTMEREQQEAAEQALSERNRMFAYGESGDDLDNDDDPPDFGGGRADGGGVGDKF